MINYEDVALLPFGDFLVIVMVLKAAPWPVSIFIHPAEASSAQHHLFTSLANCMIADLIFSRISARSADL